MMFATSFCATLYIKDGERAINVIRSEAYACEKCAADIEETKRGRSNYLRDIEIENKTKQALHRSTCWMARCLV